MGRRELGRGDNHVVKGNLGGKLSKSPFPAPRQRLKVSIFSQHLFKDIPTKGQKTFKGDQGNQSPF